MAEKETEVLVEHEEPPSYSTAVASTGVNLGEVNLALEESSTDDHLSKSTTDSPDHVTNNNTTDKPESNGISTTASTPVYYSSTGGAHVASENVVVNQEDGSRVIISPISQTPRQTEKEVKARDIKFLKIFSVVAIILFLPLGILALLLALKASNEFYKPAEERDKKRIKKFAKRCETCIIFSLVAGLMSLALTFAIVERYVWEHDDEYWNHRAHGFNHVGR